jgi:phosphatidate cytidylyltransferase
MLTRTITGAIFVIVLIGAIIYHPVSLFLLFLVFSVIGTIEAYRIAEKAGASVQKLAGILASVITYSILSGFFLFKEVTSKHLLLILLLPFAMLIMELFRNKTNPFFNLSASIFGVFYVALPFALLSYLASYDQFFPVYNPSVLLGFFILVWTNDTGAYLAGKSLGRTKLFERISPNKTWEGTIGGVVLALIVAYVLSLNFPELSLLNWMVIAFIISLTGSLGDLVESMFKRSTGIKDSGRIMPGHGGVLDRFDAVLVSAAFVAAYLSLVS